VTCQAKFRLDNLESLVEIRTLELVRANERLQSEVNRRAAVEKELRESEERSRKSFEAALVALAMLNADKPEAAAPMATAPAAQQPSLVRGGIR
jgi:hypothetical protein